MATEGKPNASPPANEGEPKQDAEIKELKVAKQQLLDANQQLQRQIDELKGTIISPQYQEFMKVKNQPGQFSRSDFAAGRQEEPDLEVMSNAQLVQYIMDNVGRSIESNITPQLRKLSTDMQRDQLSRGIKDAKGKYQDFDNFAAQMSQISARLERSGFTAEDIYKIATHPGTAKSVTATKKDEGRTETPTSGGGQVSITTEKESPKQTAERVYDKIFGNKG